MENEEVLYFKAGDFRPKMELLDESWDHAFFYFVARGVFHLEKIVEYRFGIDDFLLAAELSFYDSKSARQIFQKGCVAENPCLRFEIDSITKEPKVVLRNVRAELSETECPTVAINYGTFESIRTIQDFKHLCSIVRNGLTNDGTWEG